MRLYLLTETEQKIIHDYILQESPKTKKEENHLALLKHRIQKAKPINFEIITEQLRILTLFQLAVVYETRKRKKKQ